MITEKEIEDKIMALKQQRENTKASLNAITGAIQVLEDLVKEKEDINKKEK